MDAPFRSSLKNFTVFQRRQDITLEGLALRWSASIIGCPMGDLAVGLKVLVLVGAGISVNAGIPDFRSPGTGLYANLADRSLSRPEDMFTLSFFRNNPTPFYEFAKSIWPTGQHRPTKTHYFLKLLQEKGLLKRIYTQNIDGLERLAGVSADMLVESHGSFASASCIDCQKAVDIKLVKRSIFSGRIPHYCESCGGLVKPDITFFGEMLPDRFYNSYKEDLESCDLLIILGTSLKVAPFNSLPSKVGVTTPRLLINREAVKGTGAWPLCFEGPGLYRDIFAPGDCDEVVEKLIRLLGWTLQTQLHIPVAKIDMRKEPRAGPPRSVDIANTHSELPPLQRLRAETSDVDRERCEARMDIQKAILASDVDLLKGAVERAQMAGLSYWELAAATEVLMSHDRRTVKNTS
jgi:NAD-dependent SIR2 family protein deacetylase